MSTSRLEVGTRAGRFALAAVVLGSGMAFLDTTVVNVALDAISRDLDADVTGLQWTLDGYLLTLSSLLLLGGALGDRLGRRRVFLAGLGLFTAASVACGLAPDIPTLVAARLVQGVGAAGLVPGSLALISGGFEPRDRGEAIGAWTAWSGITTALGPLLGGYLVTALSWRWVFFVNVPVGLVTAWLTRRAVPESRDPEAAGRPDVLGAVTVTLGLAGLVYAAVEAPAAGLLAGDVAAAAAVGIGALALFLRVESRREAPMLPLPLFRLRRFTGANLVTLAVYASLNVVLFVLLLHLQRSLGYSPLEAGAALLPTNLLLLVLSPRAGRWSQHHGERTALTLGPLVIAGGLLLLSGVGDGSAYLTGVLPGVVVFGLGLAATVAPLTTAAIDAAPDRLAGAASGVNNAAARLAGLLGIALVPWLAGLSGTDVGVDSLRTGAPAALRIAAVLAAVGGLIGGVTLRTTGPTARGDAGERSVVDPR